MDLILGNFKNDFHRDIYWGPIYIKFQEKEITVFVCASHEFFIDKFKKLDYSDDEVQSWFKSEVVDKWRIKSEDDLTNLVEYDVYATTEEGRVNGINFLMSVK